MISKTQFGCSLAIAPSPSWIERILYFFRFKSRCKRLQNVALFALEWMSYHQKLYTSPEHKRVLTLLFQQLSPIMEKAGRIEEFRRLVDSGLSQETGLALSEKPLFWDGAFQQLLKEKTRGDIEQKVRQVLSLFRKTPGAEISRAKKTKTVTISYPNQPPAKVTFPVKVDFYLQSKLDQQRIIVKIKHLVGEGGQRKVLAACDLLTGEALVSKPFVAITEKTILLHPISKRYSPFLIARNERRFYERKGLPISSENLKNTTAMQRHDIMESLIQSLYVLHNLTISGLKFSTGTSETTRELQPIPVYHGDIKPGNILFFLEPDSRKYEACFIDFGCASRVTSLDFTPFFRSPQKTSYLLRYPQPLFEMNEAYNRAFGRPDDIWSLGLTLAFILSGGMKWQFSSTHIIWKLSLYNCCQEATLVLTVDGQDKPIDEVLSKSGIPNFSCFTKHIEKWIQNHLRPSSSRSKLEADSWVAMLTQAELDRSIDQLEHTTDPKQELTNEWNHVRQMLQLDATKRWSFDSKNK